MLDHPVVVLRLPQAGLATDLVADLGVGVHPRRVVPHEERLVVVDRLLDEGGRDVEALLVERLDPLDVQRAGVLEPLLADLAPPRLDRLVVLVGRPRVDDVARPVRVVEVRELVRRRPVRVLRVLVGVEVVEHAEELVEAVHRRHVLVQVAEVVLTELRRGVALLLEQRRDRRILGAQTQVDAGQADLAQPGTEHALAGDERRPTRRTTLLGVVVGEHHPLVGEAIDVGRLVAHQPTAVTAQVRDPDVITPDPA